MPSVITLHYEKIMNVIEAIYDEDIDSVKIVKHILRDDVIKSELAYISTNYGFLIETIIILETPGQKLVKQIELVTTAIEALNSVTGSSVTDSIS